METAGPRIHRPQNIVGTGMLALGGVVLTCAHVVEAALRGSKVTPGPGAAVMLDLPSAGRTASRPWSLRPAGIENPGHRARRRQPAERFGGARACKPAAVVGRAPCLVAEGLPAVGTRSSAWGFPDGWPAGALSKGVLQGSDLSGRLDAIADDPHGHFVDPGFSGAPVFEGQGAGVVAGSALGLCVTHDQRGRRIARIIPPTHLAQALRGVVSPYRWLTAFGADDAPSSSGAMSWRRFCGRSCASAAPCCFAGPPGSGKSSVIRAGLGSRAVAAGYDVRIVRPLADAQAEIAAAFGLPREAPPEMLEKAIEAQAERQPLLLGIDQAEELVRGDQAGRAADVLLSLSQLRDAAEPRLLLALAARVDA